MPYLVKNIAHMEEIYDTKLTEAIRDSGPKNWRILRIIRNQYSKTIDRVKAEYYQRILNTKYHLWKILENDKIQTQTEIFYKGKKIISPKKIADAMNNHFEQKIWKIWVEFTKNAVDPIEILAKIVRKYIKSLRYVFDWIA